MAIAPEVLLLAILVASAITFKTAYVAGVEFKFCCSSWDGEGDVFTRWVFDVCYSFGTLSTVLQKILVTCGCFVWWLRSSLWLQFKPHQIAAGAAYLAAKSLNMDLSSCQNIWQEFHTPPAVLKDVVQQLVELF